MKKFRSHISLSPEEPQGFLAHKVEKPLGIEQVRPGIGFVLAAFGADIPIKCRQLVAIRLHNGFYQSGHHGRRTEKLLDDKALLPFHPGGSEKILEKTKNQIPNDLTFPLRSIQELSPGFQNFRKVEAFSFCRNGMKGLQVKIFLAPEVIVNGPQIDPCLFRDHPGAYAVEALFCKQFSRRQNQGGSGIRICLRLVFARLRTVLSILFAAFHGSTS